MYLSRLKGTTRCVCVERLSLSTHVFRVPRAVSPSGCVYIPKLLFLEHAPISSLKLVQKLLIRLCMCRNSKTSTGMICFCSSHYGVEMWSIYTHASFFSVRITLFPWSFSKVTNTLSMRACQKIASMINVFGTPVCSNHSRDDACLRQCFLAFGPQIHFEMREKSRSRV
jgi:hypothetical protein